jgi:hypothetical protein
MEPTLRVILLRGIFKKLFIILSFLLVILIVVLTISNFNHDEKRHFECPILFLCLFAGIVGGFVRITYRLPNIPEENLELLQSSWFALCVSPLSGGFFALVLYLLFVGGLLTGPLFPRFENSDYWAKKTFFNFLNTPLVTYKDMAKVLFWSFIAGYSERFVQHLIEGVTSKASQERDDTAQKQK